MKKKCYLDANVLIYFFIGDLELRHRSIKLLENLKQKSYSFAISTLVIDEFLQAMRYYFSKKYQQTLKWVKLREVLEAILQLPKLEIINPPLMLQQQLEVVVLMQKYNLSPRDAYHLFIVLSNNIDCLATFDSDFGKVKEVEIVGLDLV